MAEAGQTNNAADPQAGSGLFQRLPQETRDGIYALVFSSTRLAHGKRLVRQGTCVRVRPSPNALALLRTCRRARREIRDSWMGQVLLCFQDVGTLLDRLAALPPDRLAKLRHLRVSADALSLYYHRRGRVHCSLTHALRFLPGLRLDVLTAQAGRGAAAAAALDALIRHGSGWKELRYISHSSALLGCEQRPSRLSPPASGNDKAAGPQTGPRPQPAHWQRLIEQRDGAPSWPSVAVYHRAVRHASSHVPCAADGEPDREIMVVVRRGSGVDYTQPSDDGFSEDVFPYTPGRSWQQVRHQCVFETDDCSDEAGMEVVVDTYDDVDDLRN